MKHFVIYYPLTYMIGRIRSRRMKWPGKWHGRERERERERESVHMYVVHKQEGANFENLKYDGMVWNGFIWVNKKTAGRLLSTCY
jgi:uncharacterized membrane-anchored protein